jgi:hypothetical protein
VILVDANVFMYAAGKPSRQRAPSRRWLESVVRGERSDACTDAEVLQEILHRYRAIGVPDTGFRLFDSIVSLGIPVLPVTEADLRTARTVLAEHPHLSTRDGVHLGVMRQHGIHDIVSYDRGFSSVPWIARLEP